VAEDAAFTSVRDAVEPTVYVPLMQRLEPALLRAVPSLSMSVRVNEGMSPHALRNALASGIMAVDPALAITFRPMDEQLAVYHVRERLLATIASFFGALTLIVAAAGLYGITAHAVRVRSAEIGIRLALGADGPRVVQMILVDALRWSIAGLVAGVLAAYWAAAFVQPLLYAISARDAVTFAVCAVALAAVILMASWLSARHASSVDPATTLRV
jgi:hypothetical protein